MGDIASLVNTWLSNRRTRQTIRNIEKNNELRRNITRYDPSDIEGFIERDANVGSYIISGGNINYRAKAAASVAACSLEQNIPVVIIHEGDKTFESDVTYATSFTNNKVIITSNTAVYDPLYNRTNNEICNLILNSCNQSLKINASGQQYILGLAEFIKSKNIPPYCEMFVSCPHDEIFEKIDESEQKGFLNNNDATKIRNELMQGQTERASIQSFFSQLSYQGMGIISNKGNRNSAVNIKTAVKHNGLLMMDIGSSTNEILINLVVNEIKEVLASGKQIMLILDDININSNELLSKLIKSISTRCLTTFVSTDVYSMLGADEKLFYAFTANACKCIIFSHTSGATCNKWSELLGYYDVDKVSQNIALNQNYQWGYSSGNSNSISVSTNREFIVKPEEISRMKPNEVFILDRNAKELAHTTIR